MGTTAQKLQAIIDAKNSISAAIEAKGGTVPHELSGYGPAIEALPSGGGSSYSEEMASQLRAKNERIKIFQQELPQELIAVKFKNYSQTYTSGTSQIIDTGWTYISGVTSLGDAQFTLIGSLPKALSGLNSVGKVSSDVDALVYYENDVYSNSSNRIRSDGSLTGNTSFAARIPEVRYLDMGCAGGLRSQDSAFSPFKNLSKLETLVFGDNLPMNATPRGNRVGDTFAFWNMEGCTSLKEISLSRKAYLGRSGYYNGFESTFNWNDTLLSSVYISDERLSYGTVGAGFENNYMGQNFLAGATHLKNIRIPSSIESINVAALSGAGTSDDPNEPWEMSVYLGDKAYADDGETVLWDGVKYIENRAFKDCSHLLSLELPSSIESLSATANGSSDSSGYQFDGCGSAASPQEFTLDCRKLHNPPSFGHYNGGENETCLPEYGRILVKDADYDNWISVMDANGWTVNKAKVVKESEA